MRPIGVSNMSSACVGIQRIIKKESPLVVYVQCGGRCLNLAIARSSCSLTNLQSAIDKMKGACFFFQA